MSSQIRSTRPSAPVLLMLVLGAAIALLALLPAFAGAAGTGSISGTVTDSSANPLQYSCVKAYDSGGTQVGIDSSDFAGDYVIDELETGGYRVEFAPCDNITFLREFYENEQTLAAATTVSVTNGSDTSGIDAQLALGGSISGKVTNSSDVPVSFSCVMAYDSGGTIVGSDNSDGNGDYSIVGLASGDYGIEFRSCGRDVRPEFYDDQETLAAATAVAVTAGSDTSGIDAQLAPGGSISGTITDSAGAPLEKICVHGYDAAGEELSSDRSDLDGNYTLAGFDTGDYRIEFEQCASNYNVIDEFYSDKETLAEATPVPVTAGSVTPDIDIQLARGGSISGTLIGGSGSSGSIICFSQVQAYDSVGDTAGSSVFPDSSGRYTINRLRTGDYRVQFVKYCADVSTEPVQGLPPVIEFYRNKETLDDATPVSVTAGLDKPGIDAVLGGPDGSISGQVTNSVGTPLEDICVTVYLPGGDTAGSARTDSLGKYKVFALAAGDYRLRFNACSGSSSNVAPEFYDDKSTLGESTTVPVATDSDTTGVDAQLAPGGSISGTVSGGDTGYSDPSGLGFICRISVDAYDSNGDLAGSDSFFAYSGDYSIRSLATGNYRLKFTYWCGNPSPVGGNHPPGTELSEFYDDESTLAAAIPVSVTAGSDTPNIDAEVNPRGSISGRVADEQGDPLEGICVSLYDTVGYVRGIGPTDADGNYMILDLWTDDFRLQFQTCPNGTGADVVPEFYSDSPTLEEAWTIPVNNGFDTSGIDIQLAKKPADPTYKAVISKLGVKGPAKIRKGRKATFGVKIRNSGNVKAKGVKLKVQGRGVSFNASVGAIPAGAFRTVKVGLKPKKAGKTKLTFRVTSSNAGGQSATRRIRVVK